MAQDHYAALFTKLSEEGFDSREFVRRLVERGLQDLIDAGVAAHIGADPHERTPGRTNRRNGKRPRTLHHPGRRHRDRPAQAARGQLVPGVLRTAPAGRSGPVRGGDDRLHQRDFHPQGGPASEVPGLGTRHLQVRGVPGSASASTPR